MSTFAPALARERAMSAPIPREPPVTMATLLRRGRDASEAILAIEICCRKRVKLQGEWLRQCLRFQEFNSGRRI